MSWPAVSGGIFGQIFDQIFGQVFGRVLTRVCERGKTINAVYSTTRPKEKALKPKEHVKNIC